MKGTAVKNMKIKEPAKKFSELVNFIASAIGIGKAAEEGIKGKEPVGSDQGDAIKVNEDGPKGSDPEAIVATGVIVAGAAAGGSIIAGGDMGKSLHDAAVVGTGYAVGALISYALRTKAVETETEAKVGEAEVGKAKEEEVKVYPPDLIG